jgi:GNAT superfamily N-acetyltransferase
MSTIEILRIRAAETHDLRARVLRDGNLAAALVSDDEMPRAFHLGAHRAGVLAGVASFYPHRCPCATDVGAVQLRFMAVEPAMQGRGVGRELLDHAIRELRQQQVPLLWANGRDTALGFYVRLGFTVVGDGFIHEPGLPHHLIVFDLSSQFSPIA